MAFPVLLILRFKKHPNRNVVTNIGYLNQKGKGIISRLMNQFIICLSQRMLYCFNSRFCSIEVFSVCESVIKYEYVMVIGCIKEKRNERKTFFFMQIISNF